MVHLVEIVFWLLLAALFYTYFGYPIILLACHYFVRRAASRPQEQYRPTVSLILAAYNEAESIATKLENCLALSYPKNKLEILVGSDGSDDGTVEIARQFQDRRVRVFQFDRRGKMATVNSLVREARGEICVFSDISETFDHDAVRKLVRHFADLEIGAVTGNHIYHHEKTGLGVGTRFYWRFQRFLQSVESRLCTICMCDGTIYACRRECFVAPPASTINDDVAVPLGIVRQGKRVIFEPQAVARGAVLKQTGRFFRQKVRSQAGKYQNFRQFPELFFPWPLRRFWIYLSHSVLPVLIPWFLAIILLSNIALGIIGPWQYRLLLGVQICFYLLAFVGLIAEKVRIKVPGTAIPFYFVTANVGSLCGFFAYVAGAQAAAWRKVD